MPKNDTSGGGGGSTPSNVIVAPLVKTKWGQRPLYNNFCPPPNCLTGCNATCMAQIMYFWGWPVNGTGSHTSTCNENEPGGIFPAENFSEATYRWNLMPQKLQTGISTPEEIDAVATLMRHVGIAIDTRYTPDGSGSDFPQVRTGLTSFFRYADLIEAFGEAEREGSHVENEVWENILRTELVQKRPIFYGSATHAFVCDGYDGKGFFHFNLGWDGKDDGYYKIQLFRGSDDSLNVVNGFMYKIMPNVETVFINVKTIHVIEPIPTGEVLENPIIFPYGDVPVRKGGQRTFTIIKENSDYIVDKVTINNSTLNPVNYGSNKVQVQVSSPSNNAQLIVHLRHKKDFTVNGVNYNSCSSQIPSLGTNVFEGVYKTKDGVMSLKHINLYVKKDIIDDYKTANVWKDFTIMKLFEIIPPVIKHILYEKMQLLRRDIEIILKRPDIRELLNIKAKSPRFRENEIIDTVERLYELANILPAGNDLNVVEIAIQDINYLIDKK